MEQELAGVFRERQVAKLIEYDELGVTHQPFCEPPGLAGEFLLLELVGEVDEIKEPDARAFTHRMHGDGNRQMGFAGSSTADKDEIAKLGDELPFVERTQLCLIDRGFVKLEAVEVALQGEVSLAHAVTNGARASLGRFSFE